MSQLERQIDPILQPSLRLSSKAPPSLKMNSTEKDEKKEKDVTEKRSKNRNIHEAPHFFFLI